MLEINRTLLHVSLAAVFYLGFRCGQTCERIKHTWQEL